MRAACIDIDFDMNSKIQFLYHRVENSFIDLWKGHMSVLDLKQAFLTEVTVMCLCILFLLLSLELSMC